MACRFRRLTKQLKPLTTFVRTKHLWSKCESHFDPRRLRRLTGCYVLIVIACLLSPHNAYAEFHWFERHWDSDYEVNMQTPDWQRLKTEYPEVFKKAKKRYQGTRWIVRDGTISGTAGGKEFALTTYSYRLTPSGAIEVLDSDGAVYSVERTDKGFCVDFGSDYPLARECFRDADT